MTREEALSYLGGDEESLEEEFEMQLFSFKQYFLSKPVVSKLFEAQFKKMILLQEAAEKVRISESFLSSKHEFSAYSNHILDAFSQFEKDKSLIKSKIMNAINVNELKFWAEKLLGIQQTYCELWPELGASVLDDVLISKEPDPMEMLSDLKEISTKGVKHFEQLTISNCETLVTLFNEWKRLSLLRQKELEWKKTSSIN